MEKKQRFSLRKYKLGVASVLVGLSVIGGLASEQVAYAAEEANTPTPTTAASETPSHADVAYSYIEPAKDVESTKVESPVETVVTATDSNSQVPDYAAVNYRMPTVPNRAEVQPENVVEPTQPATLPEKEEATAPIAAVPASTATADVAPRYYYAEPAPTVAVVKSAAPLTQKARDAISSISMEAVTSEKVKVTVRTKQPFKDISSTEIWNANNGGSQYIGSGNVKDNYTFEFTSYSLKSGHWKPLQFSLQNMSGNYVSFSQRDLLPFTTGIVIGGAKEEPNQAISLGADEEFTVLPNKRQAGNGDTSEIVKYTFKIRDAHNPSVSSFYLYNDRTGEEKYISGSSYLDDNNNAVVYTSTRYFSKGVWKLASFYYNSGNDNASTKSVRRPNLYKNDYKTSLSVDKATAEPNYIPTLGNKKTGVFTNLSQVEQGSRIIITVKSDLSLNSPSLYVVNSATGSSRYLGSPILDSNGNYVYYTSTSYFQPGDYTIQSVGSLKAIDLNLDQAGFKVVEFGQNIRRTGNTATPTPQPTPQPTSKQGWSKVGNTWYYNKADGSRATNTWIQGKYYVKSNGAMAANEWVKVGNTWYYTKADGSYAANTWVQGKYYVKANGAMAANEWVKVGKTWYYTKTDGSYAANTWVQGKYYVKANGAMAANEWVKVGKTWYYTKADGSYAANTWVQGKYYVKSNGAMATNEWIRAWDSWYYVKADGSYARGEWVGNYFVKADGQMARGELVHHQNQYLYFDPDGKLNDDERYAPITGEPAVAAISANSRPTVTAVEPRV